MLEVKFETILKITGFLGALYLFLSVLIPELRSLWVEGIVSFVLTMLMIKWLFE